MFILSFSSHRIEQSFKSLLPRYSLEAEHGGDCSGGDGGIWLCASRVTWTSLRGSRYRSGMACMVLLPIATLWNEIIHSASRA